MQRLIAGTTRQRMFRELTDVLEAVTADVPMLLWLEDLHWSDTSTLDWIAAFAQRPEAARILLVGTFRSSEISDSKHPLVSLFEGLCLRGFCMEVALGGLNESEIREYVDHCFPSASSMFLVI